MIRNVTSVLVLALIVTACSTGQSAETTTTSATVSPTPTLPPGVQVAITGIAFGADGRIVLTNYSSESIDLQGGWLDQGLSFVQFAEVVVAPGESLEVGVGDELDLDSGVVTDGWVGVGNALGTLAPDAGEMALFRHGAFEDPDAIVAYVQWGATDGRHAPVAGEAGIWDSPSFVVTSAETSAIASSDTPATSADAWSSE